MCKKIYHYFLIKRSGLFDEAYYLITYPDVRAADMDPLMHFIKYGWKEGRNPSKDFNTEFYLSQYNDVNKSELNPLLHYIKDGKNG